MSRRGVAACAAAAAAGCVLSGCGGPGSGADGTGGAGSPLTVRPADAGPPVAAPVQAPPARIPVPDGETLAAQLLSPTPLLAAPRPGARVLLRAPTKTEFGSQSVLAVVRQRPGWLAVLHPELGNGRWGWLRSDQVRVLREPWSIRVDLSEREATLRRRDRVVARFPVAVGSPVHPTPRGTFGVTDRLTTGGAGSSYGCCVLALSGRQPAVPQDWPGGDRLGIHGTSAPGTIGTAASLGCLRASEEAMRLLLRHVPLGARVAIRA